MRWNRRVNHGRISRRGEKIQINGLKSELLVKKFDKVVMVVNTFAFAFLWHVHIRHSKKEWVVDNHPSFLT